MRRAGWLLVAPVLFAGCLFRNTSAPARFFAPGSVAGNEVSDAPVEPSGSGAAVKLRAVHGTAFLRERIVWRLSPVEYGEYEERLWTELPASYVQRALEAALRREPGLHLTDDVRAAALRVEVLAFDEVLAPVHAATVALAASLHAVDGRLLLERTFAANTPIAGQDPATMAQAMGHSLDEATTAVAAAVSETLGTH